MHIAILADDSQQKMLQSKLQGPKIKLSFCDSFRSFCMLEADHHFDGSFTLSAERLKQLQILSQRSTVWVNTVVHDTEVLGEDLVRYNGWNTLLDQPLWEIVAITDAKKQAVKQLMELLSAEFQIVPNLIGMIRPRVIAMLVNEAFMTYEMGVSSKEDIDTAMKLGTNYPFGPFEWSNLIGLQNIYELLNNLAKHDDRYTISNALAESVNGKTFKWK